MYNLCMTRFPSFQVRVFKYLTGKLSKVLDESLQQFTELQQVSVHYMIVQWICSISGYVLHYIIFAIESKNIFSKFKNDLKILLVQCIQVIKIILKATEIDYKFIFSLKIVQCKMLGMCYCLELLCFTDGTQGFWRKLIFIYGISLLSDEATASKHGVWQKVSSREGPGKVRSVQSMQFK